MSLAIAGSYRWSLSSSPRYIFVLYARDSDLVTKKETQERSIGLACMATSSDIDIEKEGLKVEVIIGKRLVFFGCVYMLLMTSHSLRQKYLGHFHCTLYISFSSVISLLVWFIAVNSPNIAGLDPG